MQATDERSDNVTGYAYRYWQNQAQIVARRLNAGFYVDLEEAVIDFAASFVAGYGLDYSEEIARHFLTEALTTDA
jgi:hypothetical protein